MLFDMYDQFPFWPDDLQPVNLAGRYGYPSQPPLPSNGVSTLWHIDLAWDVSDQIQKCLGPHNPNGYYYDMVPQWITKVYRGPLNYRLDDTVTGIGGGIHADLFCDTCDLFGECADAIPLTLIDQQIACARKVAQQLSDFGEPCLVQGVDIAAGIVCPDQVTAGENASYTVTVINGGSEPALDVSVTYTVPECAQFEGSNPTPDSINGNVVTWELGNILAGASIEISIIVDVDENCSNTTLVSDVSVTTISAEGGQGAENNSASCSSVFQLPSTP
jgi:uncharacterized repeat protein (TIGR01451 family)